jgi:membrane AbrB-like protein
MTDPSEPLTRLPRLAQWGVLLVTSVGLVALLEAVGLPAPFMLGPMLAAILVRIGGGTLHVHHGFMNVAMAVIGCLLARSVTPAVLNTVLSQWPLCLAVVMSTVVASSLLGWVIARWRVIPGSTAVWGLSPGGASVMVVMAEECGADGRLVAFMQYLRVVCVAGVAAVVARVWMGVSGSTTVPADWFPPVHWPALAALVASASIGAALGHLTRLPGGLVLGPMVVGASLRVTTGATIELPPSLLVASVAVIGWRIGLAFTRPVLVRATRALPQTLLSIAALIAFCGGVAWVLVLVLGVDPLTAYLATSPGGLDSAVIIAASSHADLSFITALQTIRIVLVLFLGPSIARGIAGLVERTGDHPPREKRDQEPVNRSHLLSTSNAQEE